MMRKLFIFLMMASQTFACQRITFEEGNFDDLFSQELGVCNNMMGSWRMGRYGDTGVIGHHEQSTTFIFPQTTFSCVSSYIFAMNTLGVVELNVYMKAQTASDQVQVLVMQYIPGGIDVVLGQITYFPQSAGYVEGWRTLRITLVSNTHALNGYVTIMGMASDASTVLVDSIRYIPPGTPESECELYEFANTTTETTTTTEIPAIV